MRAHALTVTRFTSFLKLAGKRDYSLGRHNKRPAIFTQHSSAVRRARRLCPLVTVVGHSYFFSVSFGSLSFFVNGINDIIVIMPSPMKKVAKYEDDVQVLNFAKLTEHAFPPTKGSEHAAGFDLKRYVNRRVRTCAGLKNRPKKN